MVRCGVSPGETGSVAAQDDAVSLSAVEMSSAEEPSPFANMSALVWPQVVTAEQQRAFCRIGAVIRGFLTRRLLKTEKVKHLRQTIMDTQEFIRSFQTEAPQKRGPCSAQDHSLQERVRAQLRAALYDIHDIFFEMPLWDRLALLHQDRELRAERELRDMKQKAKSPKERVVLSAATQRSLDRKKGSVNPRPQPEGSSRSQRARLLTES